MRSPHRATDPRHSIAPTPTSAQTLTLPCCAAAGFTCITLDLISKTSRRPQVNRREREKPGEKDGRR
ncbi:hypothetical protein EYF80_034706 [Liparis tanakae]|uniref:Uncharacterized protein n=1 Tax=Liparis tanakae TaxID=230148 RepID=A0A4Z2GNE2_9TELE|nr:hypothetical protein EYF80_034706 [Liparis tanakae]